MGKKVTVLIAAFLGTLLTAWLILGENALGCGKKQYIKLAEYKGIKISGESIRVSDESVLNRLEAFPSESSDTKKEEMARQIRADMERKNLMEQVWGQVRKETLILKYPDDMMAECMNAYLANHAVVDG